MKTLTSKLRGLFASALLLATITGCSFNPVGESTFDCNRKENPSEYCRSFKALEKSTNGTLPESRFDKEFRMSDHDRATGVAPIDDGKDERNEKARVITDTLPHNRMRPNSAADPLAGAPVRRAPIIQRTLIKRFVDENDMVQDTVVVWKEVQAPKWTGFNGAGALGTAQIGNVVPHRMKSKDSLGAPAETQQAQPASNFSQPEAGAEGSTGTVSLPAVSGGK